MHHYSSDGVADDVYNIGVAGNMVAAELQVVGGKHAGQVIPLNRKKFLIGREQDCQLRPNSEMVSRHHCVFSVDDFSVRLRDLGSTNGTVVNGERIRKEVVLNDSDTVVIGNLEFKLSIKANVKVPDVAADSDVAQQDETVVGEAQTLHETPATVLESDSQVAQPASPQQDPQAPSMPPMSDSTQILPAQMMPGQVPYQPQMMPQMGYPGMYGGYPYQPMMPPGYGQMYPQQMMPPGYPQQPYPQGQQPQPPQQQANEAGKTAEIDVALPDPSTTGASEEGASKGSAGSNRNDTEKPTGAADAIIKNYMNRRPGS
jgi:hypothetical protein